MGLMPKGGIRTGARQTSIKLLPSPGRGSYPSIKVNPTLTVFVLFEAAYFSLPLD